MALFFALTIQAFAVKPYRIPSESMVPTLKTGQRILVDRFSHQIGGDPKLGDVTVFTPPQGADTGACGTRRRGPVLRAAAPETRHSCAHADRDEVGHDVRQARRRHARATRSRSSTAT